MKKATAKTPRTKAAKAAAKKALALKNHKANMKAAANYLYF